MKDNYIFALALILFLSCTSTQEKQEAVPGIIIKIENFSSKLVPNRNIEVYLPPNYSEEETYPVLYMHDGQNVFNPETSYTGVDWGVDNALDTMIINGSVQPVIVVAVWNTRYRINEYSPRECMEPKWDEKNWMVKQYMPDTAMYSDVYLQFLVQELKPYIDKNYPTLQDRENTMMMGSSLGGLFSAYALKKYPDVFGSAACLSTSWGLMDGVNIECILSSIPKAGTHRFYFDYGTDEADTTYIANHNKVNDLMIKKGYQKGKDWDTRVFKGADHSERAWQARINIPLKLLLSK